ncbi:MAG: T9SS type A sorting domain-containing protein, partial [Bacteroidota bacterium]
PNPSSTYFIAFEGTAKYGYGVCLDDVSVTGTTPTLTVTPANQNVTSMAGITNFSVTSNTSWTASSNVPSWCMVTPSGSGNGTVTATYDQNTTYLQRIATVTVTVTGLPPVDVTVTQAPTVPPPPFALQASIAGNKVMLTWSEPVGAIGLTGYNVYRGITKLTPEPVTDTAYTDTVPAPGTYEYTVTAVYGDLESVGSSPVSATIVATSVSMAPDRSECVGDTLYIPVYVTAMNLDSLAFYISYDHSLMIPAGVPYTSLDPRFTVAGFFPEYATGTMALFMKETGTTGTDLSGEKIIELVFQLASDGITPMLFNDNLDLPPISALYNPSGIGITPVSYTGNQVVVNALPASAGSVSGTSTVVAGTAGVDFSVAAIDRAVYYSWNLPPGVTIATGAGTASITADFSSTAVSGIINVSGGNLCGYGLPSSGFEVTVIPVVPALRTVENVIVPSGQSPCYDATDTITIAGNSTYFTLEPGGSATFIAGKKIIFLPDVTIPEGGYLLAYITETNSFCGSLPPAMVTSAQEPGEKPGCVQTGVQGCKVYPNPTTGKFVIELNAPSNSTLPVVSIFGLMGETVFREELSGVVKKEISLEGKPSGIYFLHVISEDTRFTMKIIKQ